MSDHLPSLRLENGVLVHFTDQSNRYYGDFHRICILVSLELPNDFPVDTGAKRSLSIKNLEKMGVPTEAVDTERKALVAAFLETSRAYLEKPEFPEQLFVKIQQKKPSMVFLRGR